MYKVYLCCSAHYIAMQYSYIAMPVTNIDLVSINILNHHKVIKECIFGNIYFLLSLKLEKGQRAPELKLTHAQKYYGQWKVGCPKKTFFLDFAYCS